MAEAPKPIEFDITAAPSVRIKAGSEDQTIVVAGAQYRCAFTMIFDEKDPAQVDDTLTLTSVDGSYTQKVEIAKSESVEGGKRIIFDKVLPDKEYSLEVDQGPSGTKYALFKKVKATHEILKKVEFKG